MKRKTILAMVAYGLSHFSTPLPAQVNQFHWARDAQGAGADVITNVTGDGAGGCFAAGSFTSDTLLFSPTLGVGAFWGTQTNIFITHYSATGNPLWAKDFGGVGWDSPTALKTAPNGDILMAGYFQSDAVSFGSYVLPNNSVPNPGWFYDFFLVRMSPAGQVLWAISADTTQNCGIADICTDPAGNIFVCGNYSGFLKIGALQVTAGSSIFIAGFRPDGTPFFLENFGPGNSGYVSGIAWSPQGRLYLSGYYMGNGFNSSTGSFVNPNPGYTEMLLFCTDTLGSEIFVRSGSGIGEDYGQSVALDVNGDVWMLGDFSSDSLHFDTSLVTANFARNALWTKWSPSGVLLHHGTNTLAMDAHGDRIAAGDRGDMYITGNYTGLSIGFGSYTLNGFGGNDVYFAALDSLGNVTFANNIASQGTEIAPAFAYDKGDLFLGGQFISYGILVIGNDTLFTAYAAGSHATPFLVKIGGMYSGIEAGGEDHALLHVFPVPASESVTLQLPDSRSSWNYSVYDLRGQRCRMGTIGAGEGPRRLTVSDLPEGYYLLRLESGGKQYRARFLVVR